MNDQLCALMPLEHIKHVFKPYMHDCPSVYGACFLPWSGRFSGRRWYTTLDDGRQGGWGCHKTDVMRDWEWKGRKRRNMIENEASAGFEAWMSFSFLAQRQDLTWGIHQSISAGRPNFCSWVVCDYWELFLKSGSSLFVWHVFIELPDWQSHWLFL